MMISQTIDYTSSMLDLEKEDSTRPSEEQTQLDSIQSSQIGTTIVDIESQLKAKLQAVTDKMLKYTREINFTTIIDFKNQVSNPSKSCYRAAKCLCLLISAFDQPENVASLNSSLTTSQGKSQLRRKQSQKL